MREGDGSLALKGQNLRQSPLILLHMDVQSVRLSSDCLSVCPAVDSVHPFIHPFMRSSDHLPVDL
jgi:hypothetical protein